MQIGNYLQYDNVDALGNSLTHSDPCKFNAKFKGSNCLNNSNAPSVIFGSENSLGDVRKLSYYFRRRSGDTSGRNVFINIFPKIATVGDYTKWHIYGECRIFN